MEVKITKINNLKIYPTGAVGWTAVHFKLDKVDYFLHYSCAEYEDYMTLYKGRNKGHLERVSSCWGVAHDLIKFTKKPRCLKYVDTDHFISTLCQYKLL